MPTPWRRPKRSFSSTSRRSRRSWRFRPPNDRPRTPVIKVATWNVNGIRARQAQVHEWIAQERPDVVCLQEIKADSSQIPGALFGFDGYWCYWHGAKGYSGVALHVRESPSFDRPACTHPPFDYEHRIVTAAVGGLTVASVYVPNGGKDFAAKMRFLESLDAWVREVHEGGGRLILCGDLNVAHQDLDVHPKERKATAIGQLPEERALFARLLGRGLADVGRQFAPGDDQIFTWWPPWRNMRARNIGWRIDYILASADLAARAVTCEVHAAVGTSDHAPVTATFEWEPGMVS